MALWFPLWSYMWVSKFCIWMVGCSVLMSSSGLHSCVDSVRLVIFMGGCIYLLFLDWMWLVRLA